MFRLKRYTNDLINLLFPELCGGCGSLLYRGETDICTKCLADLPYTDFHLYNENLVAKQLWGRLPVNAAMALLYFRKESKVQSLMHSLKYNGKTNVGIKLGQLLGDKLANAANFQQIDAIIPVPIHPKKLKVRGYNQSEYIANGLAEILNVPVFLDVLVRDVATDSQTKKARYTRYQNMQHIFSVKNAEKIKAKHVLLIDDVITTGATLEACGNVLLANDIDKISIAAIAFTQ